MHYETVYCITKFQQMGHYKGVTLQVDSDKQKGEESDITTISQPAEVVLWAWGFPAYR
jgi:hypothetical protein